MFPTTAVVVDVNVLLLVIVPALVDVNTKLGVLLLPGVVICVTAFNVGTNVSTTKSSNVNWFDTFPTASVTLTHTPEYVPSSNVSNVIVLSPEIADVVVPESNG